MSSIEPVTNAMRADWAHDAMNAFCIETYGGRDFDKLLDEAASTGTVAESDASTAICDLICNLMHLARMHGIDPHDCIDSGVSTFEIERSEEDDVLPWSNPADKNQGDEDRDEDVPIENELTVNLLRLRYIEAAAAFDDYMDRQGIKARRGSWWSFQDMVESAVCLVDQNGAFTHSFEVEFKPGTTDIVHVLFYYEQPF